MYGPHYQSHSMYILHDNIGSTQGRRGVGEEIIAYNHTSHSFNNGI